MYKCKPENSKDFSYYYSDILKSHILVNIFILISFLAYIILRGKGLDRWTTAASIYCVIAVVINQLYYWDTVTAMVRLYLNELSAPAILDECSEVLQLQLESEKTKEILFQLSNCNIKYSELYSDVYSLAFGKRMVYMDIKLYNSRIRLYR